MHLDIILTGCLVDIVDEGFDVAGRTTFSMSDSDWGAGERARRMAEPTKPNGLPARSNALLKRIESFDAAKTHSGF